MIWQFDIFLLTIVMISAFVSLWIRDLMGAAIAFGAYSFLMCLVWTGMGAVDVAFTEAAVGAGVSTMFLIALVFNTTRTISFDPWNLGLKIVSGIVVIATGALLLSAIGDFPAWGDPNSPANANVASYYLEHSLSDTGVPNVVTSVLADYRGFDTMFETCVVFVVVVALLAILRRPRLKQIVQIPEQSLIIRNAARFMVPVMQLFGLYVVAHGHHSPGGGFQGGVILGASLILLSMAYDLPSALHRLKEKWIVIMSASGVLIYAGIGFGCLLLGGNFLDYSVLHRLLPATDSVMARSHGMLGVEIGVALTVMAAMFGIYSYIVSDGRLQKGL